MEYSKEELVRELARRRGIGSTGGAATPTEPTPAGPSPTAGYSGAQMYEALRGTKPDTVGEDTLDVLGQLAGSANRTVADTVDTLTKYHPFNVAASALGSDRRIPSLRQALDKYGGAGNYMDPGMARDAVSAFGKTLPVAASLPFATRAAMKEGAARLGEVATNKALLSNPRLLKPRVNAAGEVIQEGYKMSPKLSRAAGLKAGLADGAQLDVAQAVFTGDETPGFTAGGAALGLALPGIAGDLAKNTPLGRLLMSRAAGKLISQKVKPLVYTGSHPATRRWLKRTLDKLHGAE